MLAPEFLGQPIHWLGAACDQDEIRISFRQELRELNTEST
jgi:hypothetical protein